MDPIAIIFAVCIDVAEEIIYMALRPAQLEWIIKFGTQQDNPHEIIKLCQQSYEDNWRKYRIFSHVTFTSPDYPDTNGFTTSVTNICEFFQDDRSKALYFYNSWELYQKYIDCSWISKRIYHMVNNARMYTTIANMDKFRNDHGKFIDYLSDNLHADNLQNTQYPIWRREIDEYEEYDIPIWSRDFIIGKQKQIYVDNFDDCIYMTNVLWTMNL